MRGWIPIVVAVLVLAGCASAPQGQDLSAIQHKYEVWLDGVPAPTNDDERSSTCRNLRLEEARQKSAADPAMTIGFNPGMVAELRARSNRNIALIQSKMADFRCGPSY